MTTTGLVLRDYQVEALQAFWTCPDQRQLQSLPTGTGKTVIFARLARDWCERSHPADRRRVLIIAHTEELVAQAAVKVTADHGRRPGVVKAETNEVDRDVLVASIQTIVHPGRLAQIRDVGLVVVDEAHHAPAASYRAVLETLGCFDPTSGVRALGMTATASRGDGVSLGQVWESISYERSLLWMIRRGYLADVEGRALAVPDLELAGIRRSGGDYVASNLADRLVEAAAPDVVAKAYRAEAGDRKGILFAPTVATAALFAEALCAAGTAAEVVHGDLPVDERAAVLRRLRTGQTQVVTNCAVLTEGYDDPSIEVCVVGRPTTSAGLYQQMVGRVLRPWPGKPKALVLDVVGASGRHSLNAYATLAGSLAREPKPGETLLELMEAVEAAAVGDLLTSWHEGPVTIEAIDLFGGSRQQWLRTKAGHWFLPAGTRFLVIHPDLRETYSVAYYAAKGKGGGWVKRGLPDLSYAMGIAESDITHEEDALSRKEGRWREKMATQKAIDYAISLGLLPEGSERGPDLRGGMVGDLISRHNASLRLDGPIGEFLKARGLGVGE